MVENTEEAFAEWDNNVQISPWFGEPNPVLRQALLKLAEEAGELAAIAARCAMQGFAEVHPETGKPNSEALIDELTDTGAVKVWISGIVSDHLFNADRFHKKTTGFYKWQKLIETNHGDPA